MSARARCWLTLALLAFIGAGGWAAAASALQTPPCHPLVVEETAPCQWATPLACCDQLAATGLAEPAGRAAAWRPALLAEAAAIGHRLELPRLPSRGPGPPRLLSSVLLI